MQLLTAHDVYSHDAYETMRPDFRRRIMVHKDKRRVLLGEHCSVHFESRDTVLYQIMEMLRAECSWERPGAVEAELEAYNPLIPQTGELSATMMFAYRDPDERSAMLQQLVGIERHVWLQIGHLTENLREAPPLRAGRDRRGAGTAPRGRRILGEESYPFPPSAFPPVGSAPRVVWWL